jgi:hypothetical protein
MYLPSEEKHDSIKEERKPPIGVMSEHQFCVMVNGHYQEKPVSEDLKRSITLGRINDLAAAIKRYTEAGFEPKPEWIGELHRRLGIE